uniref:Putative rna recognition motif in rna-binding protein 7 n=1 Tax=Nyssomyia neivai TaxID=330878 RepID=A0A1L8DHV5_9DIPT
MDNEHMRTLFCGNLSEQVTEEILYELFVQAGPIEEVKIPKTRSFGFITYRHEATVPYALNLYSGTRLFGREIKISQKTQQPLEKNQPGNSLGHGAPHGIPMPMVPGYMVPGHMMPHMRPPPPVNVLPGLPLDMQGLENLMQLGQQLNANFQGNFNAFHGGNNHYGDNRSNDLVNRGKHYRSHESKKPYESNRRQRDIDKERDRERDNRSNFRDRRRHRR